MPSRRDVAAGVYQGWMERSACTHHREVSEVRGHWIANPPHMVEAGSEMTFRFSTDS